MAIEIVRQRPGVWRIVQDGALMATLPKVHAAKVTAKRWGASGKWRRGVRNGSVVYVDAKESSDGE